MFGNYNPKFYDKASIYSIGALTVLYGIFNF